MPIFPAEFKEIAKFHHFGLAVKDFNNPIKFYKNIGYVCSEPLKDNIQGVEIIMCLSNFFPNVELVTPIEENSPIKNFLKNNNELIYHICYEVQSLEKVLEIIKRTNRVICANKPKPAILFNNKFVSFYYIKDVGLIEFLEK